MATHDALVKYYDCLKDSFNKIQVKDNKVALVNAALRPKIREELAKSKDVLISYLNYIQVFTPIYSEKFSNICYSIICPLFKENLPGSNDAGHDNHENINDKTEETANLIHQTMKEILKSKPELIEEYIHCIIKFFPNIYNDGHSTFINYFANCLEVCTYIRGEPLTILLAKLLDRINPPTSEEENDKDKVAESKECIITAYKWIYKRLKTLDKRQLENVSAAMLAAFSREFLVSENGDSLNYLIFYICSLDSKLTDLFINLLWAVFTNSNRPLEERKASVYYACSFMSRANYIEINKVLNYLETAVIWCNGVLFDSQTEDSVLSSTGPNIFNESSQLFFSLVDSILYLLTQRYRELYEKESIERLQKLDLDKILDSHLSPLEFCDIDTEQRFREVAALYGISNLRPTETTMSARKRRKSDYNRNPRVTGKMPFKEVNYSLPEHVKHLYTNYYDHRNFTVYRE
uniref:RNA polymerase I-specific transcription initiation factor RRN3 n=1 Tax=Aceria tosichella TaxID=561515 RepID=A0A6G1S6N8_9ACAR